MRDTRRGKIGLLVGVMVLVGAIIVPGTVAQSETMKSPIGTLRLHLDGTQRYFNWDALAPTATDYQQSITGSCPVTGFNPATPELVKLTAGTVTTSTPTLSNVGLANNGLGVRFLNCGRVDAQNWALRVKLGSHIKGLGPRIGIGSADLDLQGWGGVTAVANLFFENAPVPCPQAVCEKFISGNGARARMSITGTLLFDEIRLRPKAAGDAVALRGGGGSIGDTVFDVVSETNVTIGTVGITSDPAASGGIAKFLDGNNVTFAALPDPVEGTPTPTVHWQSSIANDCLTNVNAAFADIGATGATYSLTPATTADDNKCFRAQARNGVNTTSTSNVIQLSLSTVTLEFVTAPHDAAMDTKITGTDFDPSGGSVQVALEVDGNPSSAFDGSTVTITEDPLGSISGATSGPLSGGFADFSTLQIGTAGDYNLTATLNPNGPSTGSVPITITPAGVCPDSGVSGQQDFTTPDFDVDGQGTLNIGGLTSNQCAGLDVAFSSVDGVQQWSIEVNKLSVEDKLTGYATWTWDLPGNDPVPWTEVKWKANIGGTLQETNFVDLPRCNAEAVTEPLPDPALPNQAYVDLFPTVTTNLGDITAGVCLFASSFEASGNTYLESQQIAIFEDPGGRKG